MSTGPAEEGTITLPGDPKALAFALVKVCGYEFARQVQRALPQALKLHERLEEANE